MCGICGVVSFHPGKPVDEAIIRRMCRVMHHRGPDDEGYYLREQVGLGMRRLSIIDLVTGQQPITNEDGTIWLVYNGEIYNYREVGAELERRGHTFASRSDSEIIVHAYEEYGDRCVEHFNGMFAFALWDSPRRRLLLARDRIGIKPLYYRVSDNLLVFGSELKAVITHPAVPRDIDPAALDQLLTLEYTPAPRTILQGICKLPPGHLLVFQDGRIDVQQYWDLSLREVPEDEESCAEELAELIADAVRLQLVSDVPLGAFLSGGMDSSTVVSFMAEASTVPVRTFSVGFEDSTYNELPHARVVAARYGTKHHEEILAPDILSLVEHLIGHLDEPLGDFSLFPTYLVSKMASRSVKVALSGDGGDELFGGYESYVAQDLDRFYGRLPGLLRRRALPALLSRVPPQSAKKGFINKTKRFVEGAAQPHSLQHTRWMMFLSDEDKAALYRPALRAALNGGGPREIMESYFRSVAYASPLAQQQYVDIKTYLPDNILAKVDRMSMAASLETRVPLLDHRVVEFALSLPSHMKLRRGQTKVILRKAMAGRLPPCVLDKPKQGFSIPLKQWLRGPLQPLMTDLLSEDTVLRRGYFEPSCVARWVSEHLEGRANHSHRLWALMTFELWHQRVLDRWET